MSQYLIAIHRPNDYDASVEDDAMRADIDALNDEMVAQGVRLFVGGLKPIGTAWSLRPLPGDDVATMHGPYLQASEHVGGFWVLQTRNAEEALAWGRKAAIACRAGVEVRPFHP